MSLNGFQTVLALIIASPSLVIEARGGNLDFLVPYDLTTKEQARVQAILYQKGVATSCSLYRSNRLMAIYTLLPKTCDFLGDRLKVVLDHFWKAYPTRDLQFNNEAHRFAEYLRQQMDAGHLSDAPLLTILEEECASL